LSTDLVPVDRATILEKVATALVTGNVHKLTWPEKMVYLNQLCQDFGNLNPRTKPFEFIRLPPDKQGVVREMPYVTKDGGAQLSKAFGISLEIVSRETTEGETYRVVCKAKTPDGRTDEDDGVTDIKGKSGNQLANAQMVAVTKAKRRATLSIVGCGFMDESELETMSGAEKVPFPDEVGKVEVVVTGVQADGSVPDIKTILEEGCEVGLSSEEMKAFVGAKDWSNVSLVVRRALWNHIKSKKGKTE
jgi:hypothetical protein